MMKFKDELKKKSAEKLWKINQEAQKILDRGLFEVLHWAEKQRANFYEWKVKELENKEKRDRSINASKAKIEKNEYRKTYYKVYEELLSKTNKKTISKKIVVNYLIDNYSKDDWHNRDVNQYHKEARNKFKLS
jgi:hypothetical protein